MIMFNMNIYVLQFFIVGNIIYIGGDVMIDYSPMWQTMQDKGISQYYLIKHGIDNKTLYNIKRNENITMLTLEKLCKIIGCEPNDIVKFTDN